MGGAFQHDMITLRPQSKEHAGVDCGHHYHWLNHPLHNQKLKEVPFIYMTRQVIQQRSLSSSLESPDLRRNAGEKFAETFEDL